MTMSNKAKSTRSEYQKRWQQENRDKWNAYQREWKKKNRDKVKQYNESYWEKKAAEAEDGNAAD